MGQKSYVVFIEVEFYSPLCFKRHVQLRLKLLAAKKMQMLPSQFFVFLEFCSVNYCCTHVDGSLVYSLDLYVDFINSVYKCVGLGFYQSKYTKSFLERVCTIS